MHRDEFIKKLNQALADEWLAHYQYWLGAKVLCGPLKEAIIKELKEHSEDELRHAGMLADRILELEGIPLLNPQEWFKVTGCGYEEPKDPSSDKILEQNIRGEICAIDTYKALAKQTIDSDSRSHMMILKILDDEIEHKEDLQALQKEIP